MPSCESPTSALMAKPTPSLQRIDTNSRRPSTTSNASPNNSLTSPRVQLVPHSRTSSYEGSLSPSDIELLANTNFDSEDISSRDFDFDDVFTYDKPQKKLKSIVEVSSTRDWSHFALSSYHPSGSTRQRYNRSRSTAEMYLKNQGDARKR